MIGLMLAFSLTVSPLTGQALMDDVSKRAVQYFWEQSNPLTGLAKDRASNSKAIDDHDVASVAATGYALAAYAVGSERGWLPKAKARDRTRMTLRWLKTKALKERGWFYHFINWKTGERIWKSEASSIDTCLLLAGAIIADSEFKDAEISALVKSIAHDIDWNWMLTDGGAKPGKLTLCMGWHPETGFIKARWNEYYEATFLVILMLGADKDIPASAAWEAIKRQVLTYHGIEVLTGGPIFMHQMSQQFLDFSGQRDLLGYDYWVEGRNSCLANRQYCIDNPKQFKGFGPNFWGLNAGDAPSGYVGNGAPRADGVAGDDGTVSPTGALASVLYIPEIAKSTADYLRTNYSSGYGKYGFSNGINPTLNWFSPDVIGIDLGMAMLSIEDARDHLPQRLSLRNPIYQRGMKRAGFHKTNEGPLDRRSLRVQPTGR